MRTILIALLAGLAAGTDRASSQTPRNLASVMGGVGVLSTNTVLLSGRNWRHVGSCGQPGGILVGISGTLTNRAGFLQTAWLLRPGVDTDRDGIADELDADNDGDSVDDASEVDGSAFAGYAATDPNVADSDGDGMSDGDEAAAMFDPWDPAHRLVVLSLTRTGNELTLRWVGRGGGTTNTIEQAGAMGGAGFAGELHRGTFPGGVPPWHKATNEWTGALPDGTNLFLRVRTDP